MTNADFAPTRTNLIRLKGELAFLLEGHDLLERKREILLLELKQRVSHAEEAQQKTDDALASAYKALREAQIASGIGGVTSAAASVATHPELTLSERRVMGVGMPCAEINVPNDSPQYSPNNSSAWTDEAAAEFRRALMVIAELAETRIAVMRLARAIQKTMRRVNALEKILMPDCEDNIRFIQDSLDESDRQTLFTLKLVKKRLEARENS